MDQDTRDLVSADAATLLRRRLDRRKLLRGTVAGALSMGLLAPAGAVLAANRAGGGADPTLDGGHHALPNPGPGAAERTRQADEHDHGSGMMAVGEVDTEAMGYDPSAFVSSFNYGTASKLPNGQTLRE